MEGIIQSIKPEGDYLENNVYAITLDNGTTAQCYAKKGTFKDKKFADGSAIGEKMSYEMTAKGNFSKVTLGDYKPQSSPNGSGYSKPSASSYNGSANDNRQTSIVRQSCLNRATDLVAAGKADIKAVLEMAEKFENWVNRVEASKPEAPQHLPRTSAPQGDSLPPIESIPQEEVSEGLPF